MGKSLAVSMKWACTLYGQLDLYKHALTIDRKTLLTLNGGGASGRISNTAFNITGFIQPAFAFDMLNDDDADGLNDRQLLDFPPELSILLTILNAIRLAHLCAKMYTLEGEVYTALSQKSWRVGARKAEDKGWECVQGILSKARGYLAKIAMLVHCLDQAVVNTDSDECLPEAQMYLPSQWRQQSALYQTFQLPKINCSSLAFQMVTSHPQHNQLLETDWLVCWLWTRKMVTEFSTSRMCARNSFQKKFVPAILCLRQQSLWTLLLISSFGEVIEVSTANRRTITGFRKKKLTNLSEICWKIIKTANVSDEDLSVVSSNDRTRPQCQGDYVSYKNHYYQWRAWHNQFTLHWDS